MDNIDWNSGVRTRPGGLPSEPDWDAGTRTPPAEPRGAFGTLKDVGISALKGAIGLPEAAVGIADLVTGGHAGKIAEDIGFRPQAAKAFLDEGYTSRQQEANKTVAEADGFWETIKAALQNPSTIAHSAIESAPSMIGGGAVARGLIKAAPKLSPVVAAGIGEGAVTAGQNVEQLRQETESGLITPSQAGLMAASGALTGVIGIAGGKLAAKMGILDIDTWLAKGGNVKDWVKQPGLLKRVTGGALSEGVFEELPQSAQEQVAQNIALGKPWDEKVGAAAAMGGLVGGLMGAGANVVAPTRPPPDPLIPVAHDDILSKAATIVAGAMRAPSVVPVAQAEVAPAPPQREASAAPVVASAATARPAAEPVLTPPSEDGVTTSTKQSTTGLTEAFKDMGGGISEAFYGQAFDALQSGKTTISGVNDPILTRAKAAFDAGLIKSPDDIKLFENQGYPTPATTPDQPKPYAREREALTSLRDKDLTSLTDDDRGFLIGGKFVAADPETGVIRILPAGRRRLTAMGVGAATVDEAAHAGATSPNNDLSEPTDDQKSAGNYKLGHVNIGPFDISVENAQGSVRKSKVDDPNQWEITMQDHYGYYKGPEIVARAPDKARVDAFIKPGTPVDHVGPVYVIDQNHKDGTFDEPKSFNGYGSRAEAVAAYLRHYPKGHSANVRGVTELSTDEMHRRLQTTDAFLKPQPEATPLTDQEKQDGDITPQPAKATEAPVETKAPDAALPEKPVAKFTPEELTKIRGKLVADIALPQLRRFVRKGSPRVKAAAQAEIARREAATELNRERKNAPRPGNDPFLLQIKKVGGINVMYAEGLTGEKAFRSNSILPGLFRKQAKNASGVIIRGHGLDEIARMAIDDHWMLAGDILDGSVADVTAKISAHLRGERGIALNLNDEDAQFAALRDKAVQGLTEEEQIEADELSEQAGDKPKKWDTMSEEEQNAEADKLFGPIPARAGSSEAVAETAVEPENIEQRRAAYNADQQGFDLAPERPALKLDAPQSNEEVAAAERAQREARTKAEAETKSADAQAKSEREKKEVAQRSAAAADDFSLTGTEAVDKKTQSDIDRKAAEVQLAGQGSMFEPKPEYNPDQQGFDLSDKPASAMSASDLLRAAAAKMDADAKASTEPKSAPTGSIRAKPGVDMVRMAKLLGPQLYGNMKDVGPVTIKELFQNSFDALKGAINLGQRTEGHVSIDLDAGKRQITLTDDGTGMTPKTINDAFLTLAGTAKETDRASGGLGIAKMLFLFGNKSLKLVTIRDGVESTLETSGAQLMAAFSDPSQAPNIETRKTAAPSGTTVTVEVPETYRDEDSDTDKAIDFPSSYNARGLLAESPLFENVEVKLNGDIQPIGTNFPADEYTVLTVAKFAWGNARVLIAPVRYPEYSNVSVLSNGLYQFGMTMTKDPANPYSSSAPYKLFVNIEPNVKADAPNYPISLNRKGFSQAAGGDFTTLMKYIGVLYANKQDEAGAQSFGVLSQVSVDGKKSKAVDLSIPVAKRGTTLSIDKNDKVEVRDGKLYVNNREIPELTKAQMEEMRRDPAQFRVDQAKLDTNMLIVHDNVLLNDKPYLEQAREELGAEAVNGYLHGVAATFKFLRDSAEQSGGADYADITEVPTGVSIDTEYYGVNTSIPFKAMMLNPTVVRGDDKVTAPAVMVGTMIHELAHHKQKNHSETGFIPELQRLSVAMAMSGDMQKAVARLQEVMQRHGEVFDYFMRKHKDGNLKNRGIRLAGDADTTDGSRVSGRSVGDRGAGGYGSKLPGIREADETGGQNGEQSQRRAGSSSADGRIEQRRQAYNEAQAELIYDNLETRPGTTPEQKQSGVAALKALFGRKRVAGEPGGDTADRGTSTVLGSALWRDFTERGGSELIGAKVSTAEDLAVVAQILRDPRFETMRVFFVKDKTIVGHTGWTSRLPGVVKFALPGTAASADGVKGFNARIGQLTAQKDALHADGYYLMHNHPSGRAKPSDADLQITSNIALDIPGFIDHIVIDHNEYAKIDAFGNGVVLSLPVSAEASEAERRFRNYQRVLERKYGIDTAIDRATPAELKRLEKLGAAARVAQESRAAKSPEVAHDTLGKPVAGPFQLVAVAKQLTGGRKGYVTLISTNASSEVQALAEVPAHILTEAQKGRAIARVRRFLRMTGSNGYAFVVGENPAQYAWLMKNGTIADATDAAGKEVLSNSISGSRPSSMFRASVLAANQEREPYESTPQSAPTLFPQWQGEVEGVPATDYLASDNGQPIGNVSLHERNGVPAALFHIEALSRGTGAGTRILQNVMNRTDELHIWNIRPDSVEFWRKMGVDFIEGSNDGTLTKAAFEAALGRSDRAASQAGVVSAESGGQRLQTAAAVRASLGPEIGNSSRVEVHQSVEDLPEDTIRRAALSVAYHGSPHQFDKFSLAHIGTGEGAQAYGHGLYFSGRRGVAEHYRNALGTTTRSHNTYRGQRVTLRLLNELQAMPDQTAANIVIDSQNLAFGQRSLVEWIDDKIAGHDEQAAHYRKRERETKALPKGSVSTYTPAEQAHRAEGHEERAAKLRAVRKDFAHVEEKKNGKLYQVDLLPKNDDYLLWDKPLSEQSEKVKAALKDAFDGIVNRQTDYHKASELSRKRGNILNDVNHGAAIYNWMAENLGSDRMMGKGDKQWGPIHISNEEAASRYLNSIGIPGIKYLDGSSRSQGEGSFNYVIFDDSLVQIEAMYSKIKNGDVQGLFDPATNKVHLIADNIPKGKELAVLLHEGVHAGLEKMLGTPAFNRLVKQVNLWAEHAPNTEHGKLAVKALARIPSSTAAANKGQETIAYFVEEAVNAGHGGKPKPTDTGAIARWFKLLWDRVAAAIRKLGANPDSLTTADIVAMARGALNRELKTGDSNITKPEAVAFNRATREFEKLPGGQVIDRAYQKNVSDLVFAAQHSIDMHEQGELEKPFTPKQLERLRAFVEKWNAPLESRADQTQTVPDHIAQQVRDAGGDPDTITVVKSRDEYRDFQRRYGLPNALADEKNVPFGRQSRMFVDDDNNGKPVAVFLESAPTKQTDPANADIRFSRGALARGTSMVSSMLQSSGKLGMLNGIATQYHKALMLAKRGMPEFKAVFDRTQAYLNDITSIAVTAEQQAPSIFRELRGMSLGSIKQYFKGAASDADIAATQPALHVGTLFGGGNPMEGRLWTDEELKYGGAIIPASGANLDKIPTTFKKELKRMPAGEMRLPNLFAPLSAKQIELYKQARATVDKSLEDQAKSIIYRHVKGKGIEFDKGMNLADVAQLVQDQLTEAIGELNLQESSLSDQLDTGADNAANARIKKMFDKAQADGGDLKTLKNTVTAIEAKANKLIAHGYMPLQRFGNRVVMAKDANGKTQFVGFYDGNPLVPKSADVDMNRAAMALRQMEPTWTVTTERKSERAWQLYTGLNLDALENFLDFLDPETKANLERDNTIQEYLQNAVNSRSTLTRMIHRKGTPGFSTDIPRTLASFITSNARSASGNYHAGAMKSLVEDIQQGDIKDEAADLVKYILEPQEEAAKIRSFLFFHFLGGSIAAGLVNLSQTPMMTAPALLAHAGMAKVISALTGAAKNAIRDPATIGGELGKALHKAELEGVTAPQMVYHLTATAANNPFSGNRHFRTFMAMWGGMFSATEAFNRRVAFMAAFEIAQADKSKGDPYEFAKGIVADTQLLYNKGNRPNLGRGAIGATVLTFKTFTIGYLELLRRLPPKQQLMMLGLLLLMAGAEGLPFAEDIEDLVDTLGQALGFTTNTHKWLGKTIRENLGPEFERPILHGLGGMLPIALHSRLGFGNVLPATSYFKASEIDKTRDVAEAVGPIGSVLKSFSDSLQMLARGRWDAAAVNASPKAVRDAYNGAHMLTTGEAEDTKGRITLKDVTLGEAVGKAIGFNPQRAAAESEVKREAMMDKNLRTVRMDEIAGDWADSVLRNDPEKRADARERLLAWNRDNPQLRIEPQSMRRSVQERVRAARLTGEQRFLKSLPKPMRSEVRQEFNR